MYSEEQICHRLKTTEKELDLAIELIEDAGYECKHIFNAGQKYYNTKVVGWMLQLSKQVKSEQVQDFVADEVDESAIADYMSQKPKAATIPYVVEPQKEEEVELSKVTRMGDKGEKLLATNHELPTNNAMPSASSAIALLDPDNVNAIANQVQTILSPTQIKNQQLKERLALQERLREAIDNKYQLSTQDVVDITGRNPHASVRDYWVHGRYAFTYLGRGFWKPWDREDAEK